MTDEHEVASGHIADAPPERFQRTVLAGVAVAGLLCLIVGWAADWFVSLAFGLYLLTYCGVVAASWLPPGKLSGRVDDFLDHWIRSVASGFYGLVALSTFVALELGDLYGDLADFSLSRTAFTEFIVPWIIGFSIESMMNMLWSGLWPMRMAGEMGAPSTAVFAALAWGVFWMGSRVFPTEPLAKRDGSPGGTPEEALQALEAQLDDMAQGISPLDGPAPLSSSHSKVSIPPPA
ncbi:MAG TPA: hypothetical protein VFG21_05995 [Xanthomonadaceae bacterium]|nr:hypothetical protein [Xanthomonadaceae bacterium]